LRRLNEIKASIATATELGIVDPRLDLEQMTGSHGSMSNFFHKMVFLLGEKYLTSLYNEEKAVVLKQIRDDIETKKKIINDLHKSLEDGSEFPLQNSNNVLLELERFLQLYERDYVGKNIYLNDNFFYYNMSRIEKSPNFRNPNIIMFLISLTGFLIAISWLFLANEFKLKDEQMLLEESNL